jgi:hypothetical protein
MRMIAYVRTVLVALVVLSAATVSFAQIGISVSFGPPALPVYEQPICPGDGYIWTPGYWAWNPDDEDYYWVPGTWVLAPEVGYLWTPPWWGWSGGVFLFHEGYWGPHIGFYGGVNYGFGYFGHGFEGGRWDHDHFYYNRSVTNVDVVNVHNVYNTTVINNNVTINRVSYNGGPGGIEARPGREDEMAEHERHIGPVSSQTQHIEQARGNRELRASVNQGKPSIAATGRPGEFSGRGVVASREAGAPYHPPANRGGTVHPEEGSASRPAVHPNELPKFKPFTPPSTGDANRDRKYQQQQGKLIAKQEQQRQQLQQKQEQEHQRMEQQKASQAQKDQMEQRHQQQTQQLQQKHEQQQQHLQERQQPKRK